MSFFATFNSRFPAIFFMLSIFSLHLNAMQDNLFLSIFQKAIGVLTTIPYVTKIYPNQTSENGDFKKIPVMIACLQALSNKDFSALLPEIIQHIKLDFFYVQTIPIISACLQGESGLDKNFLIMILQLNSALGHDVSVSLLRMMLKNEHKCITKILGPNYIRAFLFLSPDHYQLDDKAHFICVKTILNIEKDKAFDLIYFQSEANDSSPWKLATMNNEPELAELFLEFACTKEHLQKLLFSIKSENLTLFERMIKRDNWAILEHILKQAEKIDYLQDLMLMRSETDERIFKITEYYKNNKSMNECFDLIIEYCQEYQFSELSDELNALQLFNPNAWYMLGGVDF